MRYRTVFSSRDDFLVMQGDPMTIVYRGALSAEEIVGEARKRKLSRERQRRFRQK